MCSANVIDDHGPIVSDGDQVLCEVPPQNTCQDGLCLPDTTAATSIYQSGEAQCPGEEETEEKKKNADAEDEDEKDME